MMTFTKIPARDVRPGALLMLQDTDDTVRYVLAVRDVTEGFGTVTLHMAEAEQTATYDRADRLWIAQKGI